MVTGECACWSESVGVKKKRSSSGVGVHQSLLEGVGFLRKNAGGYISIWRALGFAGDCFH